MKFLLAIFLCFSFNLLAQHSEQPQKESDSDLRNQSVLFSVEDKNANETFWLERTQSMDYFLRRKSGREDEIKKIDGKLARKLDMDFASRFLKCQYEIETVAGECKVTLRLTMKGEIQEICKKDEKKSQEMASFMDALGKSF